MLVHFILLAVGTVIASTPFVGLAYVAIFTGGLMQALAIVLLATIGVGLMLALGCALASYAFEQIGKGSL